MSRPLIIVGDKTDHGGVVIQGDPTSDTYGKSLARVGDKVTCPRKGHGGTTVIITGDPTLIIDGKPAARHGDKCACGATLLSSQIFTFTDQGDSAAPVSAAGSTAGTPEGAAGLQGENGLEVVEQYFAIEDDAGKEVSGYRYDLHRNGQVHTKGQDMSGGITVTVPGDQELRLVAWLNAPDGKHQGGAT